MAKAPTVTPVEVGAVIPNTVRWFSYFNPNELQPVIAWDLPGPGTYLLESSTDLKTWSFAGEFKPNNAAVIQNNIYDETLYTAYRMTRTA